MSKELKLAPCTACGEMTTYKLDGRPMCLQCVEDITGCKQGVQTGEFIYIEDLREYIEKRKEHLKSLIARDWGSIKWSSELPVRAPDRTEEDIAWGSIMDAARRNRECAQRLDELAMLRAVFGLEVKDE